MKKKTELPQMSYQSLALFSKVIYRNNRFTNINEYLMRIYSKLCSSLTGQTFLRENLTLCLST